MISTLILILLSAAQVGAQSAPIPPSGTGCESQFRGCMRRCPYSYEQCYQMCDYERQQCEGR